MITYLSYVRENEMNMRDKNGDEDVIFELFYKLLESSSILPNWEV